MSQQQGHNANQLTVSCSGCDQCAACAGKDIPMLIGNLVAILFSALVTTTISLIWPDNYDYKSMREIPMVDDSETGTPHCTCRTPLSLVPPCVWACCSYHTCVAASTFRQALHELVHCM
jgi:hypothetical protein